MEKRKFGRSGHLSTIAIFGAAAFWEISQPDADQVVEQVIAAGVNHIALAPSYGQAEERAKAGAWNELRQSLQRLQTETFLFS